MRIVTLLAVGASLVSAIFQDEAYQLDYHHALLGQPSPDATLFHQPYANSKASLLYTFSEQGLIGAINPKDGSLFWRQHLHAANETAIHRLLKASDGRDFIVSGHANQVNAWTASTGRLLWTYHTGTAAIKDIAILSTGDLAVLDSENNVVGLEATTGTQQWSWTDPSGDVPLALTTISNKLYYLGAHKAMMSGYKIRIYTVDTRTGQGLEKQIVASDSEVNSPDNILFTGSSAAPFIAWTDPKHNVVKFVTLDTESFSMSTTDSRQKIEKIEAFASRGIGAKASLILTYRAADASWADVFQVDSQGKVSRVHTTERTNSRAAYASTLAEGETFFTRVTSQTVEVFSADTFSLVDTFPAVSTSDFGLPQDFEPSSATLEILVRAGRKHAVRVAIAASSGDWILNQNGAVDWHRPEALAQAQDAVFMSPSASESLAEALAMEAHTNLVSAYVHRVDRHLRALRQLPGRLRQAFNSLIGAEAPDSDDVKSDTFGFRQLVAIGTRNGRLIALDTSKSGKVIWNIELPQFEEDQPVSTVSLKALRPGVLEAQVDGRSVYYEAANGRGLPKNAVETDSAIADTADAIEFEVLGRQLTGYRRGQKSSPLWTFLPARGSQIKVLTTRPTFDPVASIGKVLGDRKVLYKYLNTNLLLITAVAAESNELHMYLLDSVSGALLHHAKHQGVDTSLHIAAVASENWICYSFSNTAEQSSSQGAQLVIIELYESAMPNDRGSLGLSSNYSALHDAATGMPHIITQSFQIQEEISHLAVSQTAQGITNRLLIAVLAKSGSIVGIPRSAIDARRTVDRDPTQPEMMEGLSKYAPYFQFDPRWVLNHKREVYGVEKVIASPAVLESTSLLFSYGFDIFGTRVSPSLSFDRLGKDFNKIQMLATVAALGVAVVFVAPLVRGKQINARYQTPS